MTVYFFIQMGLRRQKKFNDVMKFKTYILEYKGSTQWVEEKIFEIKKVLDKETIPDSSEECETCFLCSFS